MIGIGLGVWLKSGLSGQSEVVVPTRLISLEQSVEDFSQDSTIVAEEIISSAEVAQSISDFDQLMSVVTEAIVSGNYLLIETEDKLLLESGDAFLLET